MWNTRAPSSTTPTPPFRPPLASSLRRSTKLRGVGPSAPTTISSISTPSPKAGTLPPGNSRNCFQKKFGRASDRYAKVAKPTQPRLSAQIDKPRAEWMDSARFFFLYPEVRGQLCLGRNRHSAHNATARHFRGLSANRKLSRNGHLGSHEPRGFERIVGKPSLTDFVRVSRYPPAT